MCVWDNLKIRAGKHVKLNPRPFVDLELRDYTSPKPTPYMTEYSLIATVGSYFMTIPETYDMAVNNAKKELAYLLYDEDAYVHLRRIEKLAFELLRTKLPDGVIEHPANNILRSCQNLRNLFENGSNGCHELRTG